MSSIRVRIRNIVGIESADITLTDKILLVAGLNGAGKTSLIQAIASAAAGQWEIRGVDRKKHLPLIVRSGAKDGVVILEGAGGSVRVSYPDGKVETSGRPVDLGTPLGMGAIRFMALPEDKRMAEMAKRFALTPTRKDFDAYWRSNPIIGLDPDAKPGDPQRDALDRLWDDIEESGWDAIHRRETSAVNMIQGQWHEVTGVRWGAAIRLEWAPVHLHRGEEYSIDEAKAAVKKAKAEAERIAGIAAVGEAKRNNLRAVAAPLAEHRAALEAARAKQATLDAEIERIVGTLEKDGEPVDPRRFPSCPHCGGALHVKQERSVGVVVTKAPAERMSVIEYEKAAATRQALIATLAEKRTARDAAVRDVFGFEDLVHKAETAEAELAKLEGVPILPADEIAMARTAVEDAEDHLSRVQKLHRAIALNAAWERQTRIREAISPAGIRRSVVERQTSALNVELGEIATGAGFAEVMLDASDATVTYAGRPYALLSESEQWRVDFAMMLLLARHEGAKLLLVDRLDLLHPQARPDVLKALSRARVPVIVGMTAREPDAAPDLSKAGLGHTAWLGGGKMEVRE